MTAAQQIRWKQQTVNVHYLMFIAGHSLLRFSPCYKIVADIQSDGRGTKAQGYHSLTKKVRVVLSAISYNIDIYATNAMQKWLN